MSKQQDTDKPEGAIKQPEAAEQNPTNQPQAPGDQPQPRDTTTAEPGKTVEMGALLVFVTFLFIVPIIVVVTGWSSILTELKEASAARGLITFVISLGVINIAIILTLAALMGKGTKEAAEKFNRAKEVLTILIGILGTIVGFYFGQATATQPPAKSPTESVNTDTVPSAPVQNPEQGAPPAQPN